MSASELCELELEKTNGNGCGRDVKKVHRSVSMREVGISSLYYLFIFIFGCGMRS